MNGVLEAEETTEALAAVVLGENAEPAFPPVLGDGGTEGAGPGGDDGVEACKEGIEIWPAASAAAFPPAVGDGAASADGGKSDEETVPHAFHNILHDQAAVAAPTYRSLTRIFFWIPR